MFLLTLGKVIVFLVNLKFKEIIDIMKKFLTLVIALCAFSFASNAQLSSILSKLKSAASSAATAYAQASSSSSSSTSTATDESTATASSGSTLNSIVNAITGAVTSTQINEYNLAGKWTFKGSAVAFESQNALANVGAKAAAPVVASKLDTYLAKVGIKPGKFAITFGADSTCTMSLGSKSYPGTWKYDKDNSKVNFKFANYFSTSATTAMNGSNLQLLFESKKLLALVKKVSSLSSSNSTMKTVGTLLSSYDDMQCGFEMTK